MKNEFEDCKYKRKAKIIPPGYLALNFIIKTDLSLSIDRKLIDLKEQGVKLAKSEYLARCVEAGHKTLTFNSESK